MTIQLTKTNNTYVAVGYEHLPINWGGCGEEVGVYDVKAIAKEKAHFKDLDTEAATYNGILIGLSLNKKEFTEQETREISLRVALGSTFAESIAFARTIKAEATITETEILITKINK